MIIDLNLEAIQEIIPIIKIILRKDIVLVIKAKILQFQMMIMMLIWISIGMMIFSIKI